MSHGYFARRPGKARPGTSGIGAISQGEVRNRGSCSKVSSLPCRRFASHQSQTKKAMRVTSQESSAHATRLISVPATNYRYSRLAESELHFARDYLATHRELFFGAGWWLTEEFLETLLGKCLGSGAVLLIHRTSDVSVTVGITGYWCDTPEFVEADTRQAFVPFGLRNSDQAGSFIFLASLRLLLEDLATQGFSHLRFAAASGDVRMRRLYRRFAEEGPASETAFGFEITSYRASIQDCRQFVSRFRSC